MENRQRHHNVGRFEMTGLRLRQLVFASLDRADIDHLRHILDLRAGFVDPGVAEFGLTNGVFALGDQFLEVVVPTVADTAAGRFIDRTGGLGGYMTIFQTDDLAGVRHRADAEQIRRVWNIDLPDISASHLHPADMGAAIVSVDEARPAGSWRWGGPDWRAQSAPGRIEHLTVTAISPQALSRKWGQVLGVAAEESAPDLWTLPLQDGTLRIVPGARDALSIYHLSHPDPEGCLARAAGLGRPTDTASFMFAGVSVSLKPIDPGR